MRRLTERETAEALRRLGLERPWVETFGLVDPSSGVRYDFHRHRGHQLMVPLQGGVTLETEGRVLVAGPGQAIWIRAGQMHATAMQGPGVSVYFDSKRFKTLSPEAQAFAVPEVVRTMAEHAAKQQKKAAQSRSFFCALHELCEVAVTSRATAWLPQPRSFALRRGVEQLMSALGEPDFEAVAHAAGMSPRTLRRAFRSDTGLSVREYLHRARMLWAMHRLEGGSETVLEVALAVGFQSPSAFAVSFRRFFGRSPSRARRRFKP